MTERLQQAAAAYRDHALACPVCSDPEHRLRLCDRGEQLMSEFYDALRNAARCEKGEHHHE